LHKRDCIKHNGYYIINTIKFSGGKIMTVRKNEVEELRELLHKAIKNDEYKEILKISKELDELIIKYIKSENRIEEKSYDI